MTESAFSFLPQGAIIQEFRVAGHNIVLGFPSAETYKTNNTPYFGETIGRIANRVSGAKLKNLNNTEYTLRANNGANSLHGGEEGWGKKIFDGPTPFLKDGKESVRFKYTSKDGEEGYPGTVDFSVSYTGSIEKHGDIEKTVLEIEYEARLSDSEEPIEETAINVTNHSYFTLSGAATIDGTEAALGTNLHLPFNSEGIPTGSIEPHAHVEAGRRFVLGSTKPVFDNCFVLDRSPSTSPIDSRSRTLQTAATFYHPSTQLHLEILTTEPAFQFYTGDFIDVPAVGGAPARGPRSGFAIEPGRFVNAINSGDWRNSVILKRGQVYGSRIVYQSWKG
ncbi:aldose 1-epimerase [Xylona heveae TC161]|uniref:Aldose 1-epimerase n=1 Tax=Xylona heveae (strain CBS 132557 / TC161) TaxID=1328760 RepID=A0A164ZAV1_XYLHT|nr:aldose 1-epimerase [Xylona heveae TC161]KZF18879.1 aldose 1-epimerase [Xylona heveae TC161]